MKLNKLPIRGAQNNKLMALKDDLKKLHRSEERRVGKECRSR